jgi:hypothetical protein
MKWTALIIVAGMVAGGAYCFERRQASKDVSFSEIEKTFEDRDLLALQKSLEAVNSKILNYKEADFEVGARLRKEKVVLTKLIIFKKRNQL